MSSLNHSRTSILVPVDSTESSPFRGSLFLLISHLWNLTRLKILFWWFFSPSIGYLLPKIFAQNYIEIKKHRKIFVFPFWQNLFHRMFWSLSRRLVLSLTVEGRFCSHLTVILQSNDFWVHWCFIWRCSKIWRLHYSAFSFGARSTNRFHWNI